MNFSRADADIFVPDGSSAEDALVRTTDLCVAAHADDIEIMAYAGIVRCYEHPEFRFTGVVATNGAGSPRSGRYAGFDDAQIQAIRRSEQREAARLGRYSLQVQLAHPSADVRRPGHSGVQADLSAIFAGCRAETVYLHQPADKHDTHVAVLLRCLEAIRALPSDRRPARVLGCEVWRDLDWLPDDAKVALDASGQPELAARLLRVFDSQISGGKRYDLATLGRRAANATFGTPREIDAGTAVTWAIDLTPIVQNESLSPLDFVVNQVERFRSDITARLRQMGA